ncbi:triose-phosphate isomerase [Miltoncostaea oceani]|jgi:triosephosphate isomerase (TIM)|uniref:triose-phosphate isomerase n=1 Tax=Miltoncostaea oceani TaxID=2843216 RepID=UPI001C3D0DF7|nr:triose-phosphate isomerase [Miltoncostaea oceani]
MSERRPLVAGNWKMNKTGVEARETVARLRALLGDGELPVDVAVCPPATALEATARAASGSHIRVYAQAVHEKASGAHTGEISAAMIAATGADGTLIGHSERRAAGETDDQVAARVRAALDGGLSVILCCGESLEQREAGETEEWLAGQVRAGLADVAADEVGRLAIAYEPIWAIGTGRTATPEIAQEACAHVRSVAAGTLDGAALRVLYGGSVTPDTAGELMSQPDIDGALVGGASLDPEAFAAIVRGA